MHDDDFEQLLAQTEEVRAGVPMGEKVEGTVITVGRDCVFLDLGARTEGLLPLEEVLVDDEPSVAVGDTLNVFTVGVRDGVMLCARRIGAGGAGQRTDDREEMLATLREAFDAGVPVEGNVREVNKGGFDVAVLGQRAFCPISQIAKGYTEDPAIHVGQTYNFAIIKLEEGGRNIVLSRRQLLELEAEEIARERWGELRVGATLEGTVTSLKGYGAFVDLGGIEGLIHVSEISHARVEDPAEVLAEGQRVTVSIVELDPERQRIGLSLKALAEDPWRAATDGLSTDQLRQGRVVRLAPFGAFVELVPGVEGLVHISNMGAGRRINTPREVVREGEEVLVRVLEVDGERRRIALALENPEAEAERAAVESLRANDGRGGKSLGTLGDLLAGKLKQS